MSIIISPMLSYKQTNKARRVENVLRKKRRIMSNTFQIIFAVIVCALLIFNYLMEKNDMGVIMIPLPLLTTIVFVLGISFWGEYLDRTFETDGSSMVMSIIVFFGVIPTMIQFNSDESTFHIILAVVGTLANIADVIVFLRLFHLIKLETFNFIIDVCAGPILAIIAPAVIFLVLLTLFFTGQW